MNMNIYLKAIPKYNEASEIQDIQDRLLRFKETETFLFKPAKQGTGWVKKTFSDEMLMLAMDNVNLQSGLKFYTPMRGDIGGWQLQTNLGADCLGSRRWLTYFQVKNEDGTICYCPKDPIRLLAIDAFLQAYYRLKSDKNYQFRYRR